MFDKFLFIFCPQNIGISYKARKVLPCPHYIAAIYRLDDELDKLKKKVENSTNTKKEKKEFLKKMQEMKMHFEKSYGIPLILNKYIKEKDGRYLVFCKDKKHLDTMRNIVVDWFKVAGIKNVHDYAVYSDYPDKEKDYKAFCEDKSNSSKILFAIDMLNEGVHIKDISGVIMLRTTLSNIIYLQQLGRLVEAENMGKYLLVFDFVNNFSSANDGIGLLKEIKNAIAKEKENDPNFDDSGLEDIDTFFVLEQIMKVEEMFKEIEGRLEGSWDLYIKALKQYKERMGNCDVPSKYVEVVDGVGLKLGQWIGSIRNAKKGRGTHVLTIERISQLDEIGFIWDALKYRSEKYIKALKQYKEREGGCDVPGDYVEIVDGEEVKLGWWCMDIRRPNNTITQKEKEQLEQLGFIWEIAYFRFENNVKDVAEYYKKYGKYPSATSNDKKVKKMSYFIERTKSDIRVGKCTGKELEILKRYLPELSCATKSEEAFNEFIYYAKLYKGRYGHLNIKDKDTIDGYSIGKRIKKYRTKYSKKIDMEKIRILEKLGVDFTNKIEKNFNDNLNLAKQAVKDGVIIKFSNANYYGRNLFNWVSSTVKKKYLKKQLSDEEIEILENLIGRTLAAFYSCNAVPVKVFDVIENKEVGVFDSQAEVCRMIQETFDIKTNVPSIRNHLTGKITTPYKGRFMFYRVDENEEATE